MRSRYIPWFLIFALVVLLVTFVFLFLMADPGARIPLPPSSDPPASKGVVSP
jgi:hypothetical protein